MKKLKTLLVTIYNKQRTGLLEGILTPFPGTYFESSMYDLEQELNRRKQHSAKMGYKDFHGGQ